MARYGKFFNDTDTEASDIMVTSDGGEYTDAVLRGDGWRPIVEVGEPSDSSYRVFHYTKVQDSDGKDWHIEESYTIEAPNLPPKQYSKLKIILAAQNAGMGEAFVGLLQSNSMLKLIWDASNTIEDNELLASYLPMIAQTLDKTEAEVKEFLDANCVADA